MGTTSPGTPIEIRQTSASHSILAVNRPNSDTFCISLGNNSSNNGIISVNNTDLLFGRDDSGTFSERLRMLNGGGLTFNGETAPANALDDYEEGTFSIGVTDSNNTFTTGQESGRYIKIGHVVHCTFTINCTISGTSGFAFFLTGFPFTVKNYGRYKSISSS